jgi:hypothetical protein
MRRQFQLGSDDVEYLETTGLEWETIVEGKSQWLLLHDFRVTPGYDQDRVSAGIQITPGYPDAQLDMVFFNPALSRIDGKPIGATSHTVNLDGKAWQRWSRHRTGDHPWRPGVDCLATHLALVHDWLEREFRKDQS